MKEEEEITQKMNEVLFKLIETIEEIKDFTNCLSIANALFLNVIAQGKAGSFDNPSQLDALNHCVVTELDIKRRIRDFFFKAHKVLDSSKQDFFCDLLKLKKEHPFFADVFDESIANLKRKDLTIKESHERRRRDHSKNEWSSF